MNSASTWWSQFLDALGPWVLAWGKPIALSIAVLLLLLSLAILALWLQQHQAERHTRRREIKT